MKCSDCGRYKTKECYANPRGDDWDLAENYTCFVSREQKPLTRPTPATPHLSQPYIAREGHYTPEIRELNWFQRHLNWTWVFAYLIWWYLNGTAIYEESATFNVLSLVALIFLTIVSGWVIKQKGRSLWWILLTPFFSPLWLKNMRSYRELKVGLIQEARMGTGRFVQIIGGVLYFGSGLAVFIWTLKVLFDAFGIFALLVGFILAPFTWLFAVLVAWFSTGVFPVWIFVLWLASWIALVIMYAGGRIRGED